ncbi:Carbonic anhydrase 2 [Cryptotermes secundus]|uniref:Carbonic anhydrase n=1 Tax=Cryptotermes secundus TaxID=105785 RepID=A0A2J7RK18_9NEOP|nr:carbonic anhydrase 2 isoform X2 [Cryptotermes secundus]PNF41170.1 Carbonic anhydrase 2 [Cryptotermes secundus]
MEEEWWFFNVIVIKDFKMASSFQSFVRPVFFLLLFVDIHLQESHSASSPDGTNKNVPHQKFSEKDKSKHFGYDKQSGPAVWAKMFHLCGGHSQSPVKLDTTITVTYHHPRIMWWNYSLKPQAMTISNNGHTVLLRAKWARKEDTPYHWSAPSSEEYVFEQLHFHWGQDDHSGSEHMLNNERFALEMHVVHYRRDLGSVENAGLYDSGIRVIGVFFRISEAEHHNVGLQQIVQLLQTIRMANSTVVLLEPFPLSRLVPEFSNLYLTYNGSLTTPPCAETVSWVIRKEPLTISRQQVEEFRNLMSEDGQTIKHNWRPVQPLNGRTVIQIR